MSVNFNAAASVNALPTDIKNMDIETLLMMVQSQRASLLENQLAGQINEIKARNDEISKLNNAVAVLQKVHGYFNDKGNLKKEYYGSALEKEQVAALDAAGIPGGWGNAAGGGPHNKSKLEGFINQLKGKIDSLNNSSQMDMLRLQSMTNKRNEAFDVMSNFIKKMQDSRSSIIGNMR